MHTLNHSLFKSLLFFTAGSVYQQTHTRDMEKLGGLVHSMPQTAILFLIGGLAIGGLASFQWVCIRISFIQWPYSWRLNQLVSLT